MNKKRNVCGEEGGEEGDSIKKPKTKKVMLKLKVPESYTRQVTKQIEENGSQVDGE